MRTTELVDDVDQQDAYHDDGGAFDGGAFGGGGDDWDSQSEALLDSESNIDENEEWINQNNYNLIFVLFLPMLKNVFFYL